MIAHNRLLFIFAASLFIGLGIQAPAALLNSPLQSATGHRLTLAEARGSIWSGAGTLVCRVGKRDSPCGHWSWEWDWRQLATANLAIRVRSHHANESLQLSYATRGLRLDHIDIRLPAALLGSFDEKLAALGLGGQLHLMGQGLTRHTGALHVRWQDARTRLIPNVALGEHTLDLLAPIEEEAGRPFRIGTLRGPLQLSGSGVVKHNGMLHLDIDVRVSAEQSKLSPLLAMIGRATGPGVFHFHLPAS